MCQDPSFKQNSSRIVIYSNLHLQWLLRSFTGEDSCQKKLLTPCQFDACGYKLFVQKKKKQLIITNQLAKIYFPEIKSWGKIDICYCDRYIRFLCINVYKFISKTKVNRQTCFTFETFSGTLQLMINFK